MLAIRTDEELTEEGLHGSIAGLVRSRDLLQSRRGDPERNCPAEELLPEALHLVRLAESELRRFEESMHRGSWDLKPWRERRQLLSKRTDLCRLHVILMMDCAGLLSELDRS